MRLSASQQRAPLIASPLSTSSLNTVTKQSKIKMRQMKTKRSKHNKLILKFRLGRCFWACPDTGAVHISALSDINCLPHKCFFKACFDGGSDRSTNSGLRSYQTVSQSPCCSDDLAPNKQRYMHQLCTLENLCKIQCQHPNLDHPRCKQCWDGNDVKKNMENWAREWKVDFKQKESKRLQIQ